MEFDDTVHALRTITEVRTRPPLVDIDRAMSTGRRRRRQRRTRGAVAVLATIMAVAVGIPLLLRATPHAANPATPPSRAVACTEAILPLPAGAPKAVPGAIDDTGRYVVGELTDFGNFTLPHPTGVLWHDGRIAATFTVSGHSQFIADVSATGAVVGVVDFNYPDMQGWVYVDGHVSRLDGVHTTANAINDAGVIVGDVDEHGVRWNGQPVVWRSPTAPLTRLALPGAGWVGTAIDIAADGTIVGDGRAPGAKHNVGLVWSPAGKVSVISAPPGLPTATDVWPLSISGHTVVLRIFGPTPTGGNEVAATYGTATGWFTVYPYGITPPPSPNPPNVIGPDDVMFTMGAANGWFVGERLTMDALYLPSGETLTFPSAFTHVHLDLLGPRMGAMSSDGHTLAGVDPDDHGRRSPAIWTCR